MATADKQARRRVGGEEESAEERLDRQATQLALAARARAEGGWELGNEPQECRRCSFCGDWQRCKQYGPKDRHYIVFKRWKAAGEYSADYTFFPGANADHAHVAVRGMIARDLQVKYTGLPGGDHWACCVLQTKTKRSCGNINRSAIDGLVRQLGKPSERARRALLRQILAGNVTAVGAQETARRAAAVQNPSPEQQLAAALVTEPAPACTLQTWRADNLLVMREEGAFCPQLEDRVQAAAGIEISAKGLAKDVWPEVCGVAGLADTLGEQIVASLEVRNLRSKADTEVRSYAGSCGSSHDDSTHLRRW